MSDLLRVLAVLGLVGANAFFVIGEYAVVTARRSAVAARADRGVPGARAALRLMSDPVRVISTVQVGITAIGILTGAIAEPIVRDLLGGALPGWLSFVVAFFLVTYVSVVFGELAPKALTLDRAEALVILVAPPIELISVVLSPLVWLLQSSAQVLLRPFGIREVVAGDSIRTPGELRALVDEAEQSGVIPRAQEELLHNVFKFADREAGDVMVPASQVVWLDAAATVTAALDQIVATPHRRYLVGRGSLDRLVGVVHFRDLVAASRINPDAPVEPLAKPAVIVPATKDVGALLRDLREARQELAVVADEYGGTAGIVAVEDIVEEIVGEIEDEYDLPDDTLTWLSEGTVEVAGSMSVDDFNEALGTALPQRAARTMAGLVFDELGRRPTQGDEATIGDIRLTVCDVDGARIARLRLHIPGAAADAPPR